MYSKASSWKVVGNIDTKWDYPAPLWVSSHSTVWNILCNNLVFTSIPCQWTHTKIQSKLSYLQLRNNNILCSSQQEIKVAVQSLNHTHTLNLNSILIIQEHSLSAKYFKTTPPPPPPPIQVSCLQFNSNNALYSSQQEIKVLVWLYALNFNLKAQTLNSKSNSFLIIQGHHTHMHSSHIIILTVSQSA